MANHRKRRQATGTSAVATRTQPGRRGSAEDEDVSPRKRARVFWSGRSQAVRLPKEFRIDCGETLVHRNGDRLILEPVSSLDANGWPTDFWEIFGGLGDDFDLGDRERAAERTAPLG